MRTPLATLIIVAFLINTLGPVSVKADEFVLPKPGTMVHLSPAFNPPMLKGIKVHPDNPFRFDFILDKGDQKVPAPFGAEADSTKVAGTLLQKEATKLIKYFLASLTIPEKDLWVNLSPYEKDRIVPESFGQTEMGRDLLAQDYMLKQITASLIYPEDELGKKFWKRIYEEAAKKFGTTSIPVNTFNKVWIVPEKAVVYENAEAGAAYVVESKLKVMLEEDYLASNKNKETTTASQVIREVVLPELEREVNEGRNFAQLRQVYQSLILAAWYKKKIKDSILAQVYSDQNKVAGVSIDDPQEKQKIYEQYLRAFKKGAYNLIKEEIDPATKQTIPRKYFSGGVGLTSMELDSAMVIKSDPAMLSLLKRVGLVLVSSSLTVFAGQDALAQNIPVPRPRPPVVSSVDAPSKDLSVFFQGVWTDYMVALSQESKDTDRLAKDLIDQAGKYSPSLLKVMRQLTLLPKQYSGPGVGKFMADWQALNREYLIPNGYYASGLDIVQRIKSKRYFYVSVVHKIERIEKRKVKNEEVLTIYGRKIDRLNTVGSSAAHSVRGHSIVFIDLDAVDGAVKNIAGALKKEQPRYVIAGRAHVPLVTLAVRELFMGTGMNEEQIRKYYEHVLRGHEFTHQAQEKLGIIYKGKDNFEISEEVWKRVGPDNQSSVDMEAAAMLGQFIVAPDPRSELVDMLPYILSGYFIRHTAARWILNKMEGRPVDQWTHWSDSKEIIKQFEHLWQMGPEKLREKAKELMRDNWSEELLKAVEEADSAMIVSDGAQDIRFDRRSVLKFLRGGLAAGAFLRPELAFAWNETPMFQPFYPAVRSLKEVAAKNPEVAGIMRELEAYLKVAASKGELLVSFGGFNSAVVERITQANRSLWQANANILLEPNYKDNKFLLREHYIYRQSPFFKDVFFTIPLDEPVPDAARINAATSFAFQFERGRNIGQISVVDINKVELSVFVVQRWLAGQWRMDEPAEGMYRKQWPKNNIETIENLRNALWTGTSLHEYEHSRGGDEVAARLSELVVGPRPFYTLAEIWNLLLGKQGQGNAKAGEFIVQRLLQVTKTKDRESLKQAILSHPGAEQNLRALALQVYIAHRQRSFFDDATLKLALAQGIAVKELRDMDAEHVQKIEDASKGVLGDVLKETGVDPRLVSAVASRNIEDLWNNSRAVQPQDQDKFIALVRGGSRGFVAVLTDLQRQLDQYLQKNYFARVDQLARETRAIRQQGGDIRVHNQKVQEANELVAQGNARQKEAGDLIAQGGVLLFNTLSDKLRLFQKIQMGTQPVKRGSNGSGSTYAAIYTIQQGVDDPVVVDAAMNGGIDLNVDKMDLDIQDSGKEIRFHMDPAMLRQLQNAPGFVPVIINIQPMTDLPLFLGIKNNSSKQTVVL